MNSKITLRLLSLIYLCATHSSFGQLLNKIQLFPETEFVRTFIADAHSHKMSIENIELTRNTRASMGGAFPLISIDTIVTPFELSFGASVHFELRPAGQVHIVSSEYYIDYFILDMLLKEKAEDNLRLTARFVTGHTSHHLSDNWSDLLKLPPAIHYTRDYLRFFLICSKSEEMQAYIGADYGYIFTVEKRISKPWTFQAGGETSLFKFYEFITAYAALDCKLRQEAGFASTVSYQAGIKMPMQHSRTIRFAYQFRHGLDERGQFFPQHRTLSTLGFYIEI